jgi:hypothetical protein
MKHTFGGFDFLSNLHLHETLQVRKTFIETFKFEKTYMETFKFKSTCMQLFKFENTCVQHFKFKNTCIELFKLENTCMEVFKFEKTYMETFKFKRLAWNSSSSTTDHSTSFHSAIYLKIHQTNISNCTPNKQRNSFPQFTFSTVLQKKVQTFPFSESFPQSR